MSPPRADRPRVEKLSDAYSLAEFDCGSVPLNRFLRSFALINQKSGSSVTYVALVGSTMVGYYSLTVGEAAFEDAPGRLAKGLPRYPIPVMIIARLAVDLSMQGRGFGAALLADAMRRTLTAADIAGIRGVIVHAKDARAAAFYARFGFAPFPEMPLTLYRLLKDIRARP